MNDDPTSAPLPGPDLDALLSAEADGELGAAAADLGLTLEEARARVAATPGAAARREAIARAREAFASGPPGLDDATRDRVVGAALRAARPDDLRAARERRAGRRVPRPAWLMGSAAAVVVLGLAVGLALSAGDDGADTTAAGDARTEADRAALPDVGEASDQQLLRDRLVALSPTPSASPDAGQADRGSDATEPPGTAELGGASEYRAAARDEAARDACITEIAEAYGRDDLPVLVATATFDGAPARVVVYEADGRRLVVVYAADDCTTLASQLSR